MKAETDILERCQQAIRYRFRQPELLRAVLTHASGANTRLASNERLEVLGEAEDLRFDGDGNLIPDEVGAGERSASAGRKAA